MFPRISNTKFQGVISQSHDLALTVCQDLPRLDWLFRNEINYSVIENLMLLVCQNETYLYREDPWGQTILEIVDFFLKIGQYDRPVQKQNITTALPDLFYFKSS